MQAEPAPLRPQEVSTFSERVWASSRERRHGGLAGGRLLVPPVHPDTLKATLKDTLNEVSVGATGLPPSTGGRVLRPY